MDGLIKEVDDELTDLFQQIMNGSFVAYLPILRRIFFGQVLISLQFKSPVRYSITSLVGLSVSQHFQSLLPYNDNVIFPPMARSFVDVRRVSLL